MADALFEEPPLAELYDPLDPDRSDLDAYVALAAEFNAGTVLDVGCGTGTLACLLAQRKPGAEHVRWLNADAASLPPLQVDLVTMTANVAQVFLTGQEWAAALRSARQSLRPGGRLVFESRDPARAAWLEWTRDQTYRRVVVPGAGPVETWTDLTAVEGNLVSFRTTFVLGRERTVVTSDSTLRFRSHDELTHSLVAVGLVVDEVRGAPDRPGREFVFIASRPS